MNGSELCFGCLAVSLLSRSSGIWKNQRELQVFVNIYCSLLHLGSSAVPRNVSSGILKKKKTLWATFSLFVRLFFVNRSLYCSLLFLDCLIVPREGSTSVILENQNELQLVITKFTNDQRLCFGFSAVPSLCSDCSVVPLLSCSSGKPAWATTLRELLTAVLCLPFSCGIRDLSTAESICAKRTSSFVFLSSIFLTTTSNFCALG